MIEIARNASIIIRPHYLKMSGVKNMNLDIEIVKKMLDRD